MSNEKQLSFEEIFEQIKESSASFGEARRWASHIEKMTLEEQEKKIEKFKNRGK